MNKKNKFLIATGGTGGHIFPALALAKRLKKNKFSVELVSDIRGLKFLNNEKDLKIFTINSSRIVNKNIFSIIYSFLKIALSLLECFVVVYKSKPRIVFGMGGYSSFPVCLIAKILRIPVIIYENNLFLGKANRYLLPIVDKIFVSYKELEGINDKYNKKIIEVGNIIREEILDYKKSNYHYDNTKIKILVVGGSQAARSFGEILPKVFEKCLKEKINLKIYQQCLPHQNNFLVEQYKKLNIECKIFNFEENLFGYFSKIDFAISRSGSSMLAEFLNCNIPIITIPLPTSADNHQYKNAKYFEKKGYSFLIEEDKIHEKLFPLINSIHKDKKIISQMKIKQNEFSDEKVFSKIYEQLDLINNDKY